MKRKREHKKDVRYKDILTTETLLLNKGKKAFVICI